MNALGGVVPPTALTAWVTMAPGTVISSREASLYPSYFLQKGAGGEIVLPRQFTASADPAFSYLRLSLALLRLQLGTADPKAREEGLRNAPWLRSHPGLAAAAQPSATTANASYWTLLGSFRWPFLGRATLGASGFDESYNRAWGAAQADQILRNLDIGRADRAIPQAERLFEISPSGYTAALQAESLRAAGRLETVDGFVGSLPASFRSSPSLGVVAALAARDRGDEIGARRILEEVARVFPRPALVAALSLPIEKWPSGLHRMTGENLETRELSLPKVGSGDSRPGK